MRLLVQCPYFDVSEEHSPDDGFMTQPVGIYFIVPETKEKPQANDHDEMFTSQNLADFFKELAKSDGASTASV